MTDGVTNFDGVEEFPLQKKQNKTVSLTENSSSGIKLEAPADIAAREWRSFLTLVAILTVLSSMVLLGLYPQSIM